MKQIKITHSASKFFQVCDTKTGDVYYRGSIADCYAMVKAIEEGMIIDLAFTVHPHKEVVTGGEPSNMSSDAQELRLMCVEAAIKLGSLNLSKSTELIGAAQQIYKFIQDR